MLVCFDIRRQSASDVRFCTVKSCEVQVFEPVFATVSLYTRALIVRSTVVPHIGEKYIVSVI